MTTTVGIVVVCGDGGGGDNVGHMQMFSQGRVEALRRSFVGNDDSSGCCCFVGGGSGGDGGDGDRDGGGDVGHTRGVLHGEARGTTPENHNKVTTAIVVVDVGWCC